MIGAIAGAVVNIGISAISSSRRAKERNRAIAARQAWIREEKKYQSQMFEIQTYQKSFAKEAAGSRRLGRAASSGLGLASARILNQFDTIFEGFDSKIRGMVHEHQLRRLDNDINSLESKRVDPLAQGFWAGLGSAAQSAYDLSLATYDPYRKSGSGGEYKTPESLQKAASALG